MIFVRLFFISASITGNLLANLEESYTDELLRNCYFLRSSSRPVENYTTVVPVSVKFQPIQFNGIDDKNEIFHTTGFLVVRWQLPPCANKTNDPKWKGMWRIRPGDYLERVGIRNLWYPVIWQPNGAGNVFAVVDFAESNNFVTSYIETTGIAGYDAVGKYSAHCDLAVNISRFPFDTVTCSLKFQSWLPTILVNISNDGFQKDDTQETLEFLPPSFVRGSSVWTLTSVSYNQGIITMGSHSYSQFWYSFTFERQPATFIVSIFMPALSLFILLLGAFSIPPEHSERPEFSLTIVLTFFLLQSVVDGLLPISKDPTAISIYLTCLLWLGTLDTVYFCIAHAVKRSRKWSNFSYNSTSFGISFKLVSIMDFIAFVLTFLLTIIINVTFILTTYCQC